MEESQAHGVDIDAGRHWIPAAAACYRLASIGRDSGAVLYLRGSSGRSLYRIRNRR
jgi:hypothetical protein